MTIKAAVRVAFPNREHVLTPEGAAALRAIAAGGDGKPRRKGQPIPIRRRVATVRGEVTIVRHERAGVANADADAAAPVSLEV